MRKTAILMIMTLTLCSCVKEELWYKPDMDYFKSTIIGNALVCPVTALSNVEMKEGNAIFAPDYRTVIKEDGYNITITGITDRDSTWRVEGSVNRTHFTATVHMDGRNSDGLCEWSATTSGDYDEANGYTATLEITSPATFYWEKQMSYGTITHTFRTNGKGLLQTFRNGTPIEKLEVSFTGMQASR